MKIKILISSYFLLFCLLLDANVSAANAISDSTFSFVEIITPADSVYDDGVERLLYKGVEVFDTEMNSLLKIGYSYDFPHIIKLPKGVYFMETTDSQGNSILKKVAITANENYTVNLSE